MLRQRQVYTLDQIDLWVENKVKTGKNSEYKELQVRFTDGKKISLGHKEYTEYAHMVQYLLQKAPRKKASVSWLVKFQNIFTFAVPQNSNGSF